MGKPDGSLPSNIVGEQVTYDKYKASEHMYIDIEHMYIDINHSNSESHLTKP